MYLFTLIALCSNFNVYIKEIVLISFSVLPNAWEEAKYICVVHGVRQKKKQQNAAADVVIAVWSRVYT